MILDNQIYKVSTCPVGGQSYAKGREWWYLLMLFVKEDEIMSYSQDSRNKIESYGVILLGVTLLCSLLTILIILVLIHFLAKSIKEPLQGIIDFTGKINANATEKDAIATKELKELREGEDQVATLVKAYKTLASTLINRKDEQVPQLLQISQNRIFPPNEYYKTDKLSWKHHIDRMNE